MAIAKPKVSITRSVFPILVTLLNTKVITTALKTATVIQGSLIHTGFNPRKTFLNVPPETDAIAAINAMPP